MRGRRRGGRRSCGASCPPPVSGMSPCTFSRDAVPTATRRLTFSRAPGARARLPMRLQDESTVDPGNSVDRRRTRGLESPKGAAIAAEAIRGCVFLRNARLRERAGTSCQSDVVTSGTLIARDGARPPNEEGFSQASIAEPLAHAAPGHRSDAPQPSISHPAVTTWMVDCSTQNLRVAGGSHGPDPRRLESDPNASNRS